MTHDVTRRVVLQSALAAGVVGTAAVGGAQAVGEVTYPARQGRGHVLVYGATPAGIMAAIAARREGATVTLLQGESPLGGMMTNGLGATDIGDKRLIGGLALAFFRRVGQAYRLPVSWRFEPHVAQRAFGHLLAEYELTVTPGRFAGVAREGSRLRAIRTVDGRVCEADAFIDASYEAALCTAAASTTYGRESRTLYGEDAAGFASRPVTTFDFGADRSYLRLPGLTPRPRNVAGDADRKLMAYTYRLCVTAAPDRVPFTAPPGYDPGRYRVLRHPLTHPYRFHLSEIPGGKFDLNGGFNVLDTDFIGGNVGFCSVGASGRARIAQHHRIYQQGLLYFLATDRGVPAETRERVAALGLAPDEFASNGHWPRQLYIREARRMVGAYVMTEDDITRQRTKYDVIGMGGYPADSHAVQRWVAMPGVVRREGGLREVEVKPYAIPLRSLLPDAWEASNVIAAMPFSASHVAWCSLRMEPQFMITGEAAGAAAALSVLEGIPLAELGGAHLTAHLNGLGVITRLAPR